jgi:release factor glutamine methyltransferase
MAAAALPDVVYPEEGDREQVYEPAEDTYLLMDVLKAEAPRLRALSPAICLEIGSGSGAVTSSLFASLQLAVPALFLCVDINARAAATTRATCAHNSVRPFDMVRADLVQALCGRLRGQVDVLVFNPPYVPTPPDEVGTERIEAAWAGGERGREVIDRLLPAISPLLSPTGSFYLLLEAANDVEDLCERLRALGLDAELMLARRARNERLSVWRISYSRGVGRDK